jgi:hypothetical protein
MNSPSSQVPCLKSTALAPIHFPHPLHPLPSNRAFILHKDDINKPDTSVRHKSAAALWILRVIGPKHQLTTAAHDFWGVQG